MRQKQSKKGSRKQEQRSSPAFKHEAEALPISTNTIDKSELSISEEHTPVHMQDSVPKEELEQGLDQELDQELEERYERYRDVLKDLTLMSDSFMRAVLKNPECTEEVLRTILSKKQLK